MGVGAYDPERRDQMSHEKTEGTRMWTTQIGRGETPDQPKPHELYLWRHLEILQDLFPTETSE